LIEEGLTLIGAEKHLEFNNNPKKKLMSSVKLNKFLKRKTGRRKPTRDLLKNDTF
jgi:hypothetical protein